MYVYYSLLDIHALRLYGLFKMVGEYSVSVYIIQYICNANTVCQTCSDLKWIEPSICLHTWLFFDSTMQYVWKYRKHYNVSTF